MPIKQAEMKAIADAAVAIRDLYTGDFTQLGILRSMYAESGSGAHLDALLELVDRLVWSADGTCAAHMVVVERYLERYRLTASANAANAERKRRARAAGRGVSAPAPGAGRGIGSGMRTPDHTVEFPPGADFATPRAAAVGMADLPDFLTSGDEEDE